MASPLVNWAAIPHTAIIKDYGGMGNCRILGGEMKQLASLKRQKLAVQRSNDE